jgi:hypothetical protein
MLTGDVRDVLHTGLDPLECAVVSRENLQQGVLSGNGEAGTSCVLACVAAFSKMIP